MIEVGGSMDPAIVYMHSREKDRLRVAARKGKSHRLDRHHARLELEDREAVIVITWNLFPDVIIEAEALVQSRKVFDRGNKRSFKVAHGYNGQQPCGLRVDPLC